ncbi:phosphopantetheine-binding protein [Streptomyces sp. KMM 9044]|uniref:phosphopantetheine-binding protein n=1 Tax=Streptomyces sp. KMM 9044 TaxID=2744474 RepID=UPI002151A868|nr:phosphopantetheine-binding protein [Streptomyces sp. KMM 9044]WAX81627.1 phosphopantetheine-binding protein [Streptomyces sp. KMM 9044]
MSLPPSGSAGRHAVETSSPATATERRVAAVWSDLLQVEVESLCREDDFFDLGGDSLLVLRVFARLTDHGLPLPRPTVIYRHRTLATLSTAIDAAAAEAHSATAASASVSTSPAVRSLPAGDDRTSPFPVTSGRRGFLPAEALAPGAGTWLARIRLSGPLDPDVFQAAVDMLVERHGMLRTVFPQGREVSRSDGVSRRRRGG